MGINCYRMTRAYLHQILNAFTEVSMKHWLPVLHIQEVLLVCLEQPVKVETVSLVRNREVN